MKILSLTFLFALFFHCLSAQVKLPQLIRDSMVLQRDAPLKIWGWAAPGEKVVVKLNGATGRAVAGADGKWKVQLPPMPAGGPFTMTVIASNTLQLKDILIGDVWFCSGQSNMVHQMQLHNITYAEDIANAHYPQIRQFYIGTATDLQRPHDNLPTGYWKWANPADINQFSAVAWFFARTLYEKYHVPIGLINASVGGTPIEAWTSEQGLKDFPGLQATIQQNKDTAYVNGINRKAFEAVKSHIPKTADKGLAGAKTWYDTGYIPRGWHSINVPGYWEDQGIRNLDGVVWYRKDIDVPLSMTGIAAKIFLGRIVDADAVYLNGIAAGNTAYQYPQRRYALPPGSLKPGKNTIVVRVINNAGKGGFVPGKPYYILAGNERIDLKGEWQYKVGEVFAPGRNAGVNSISLQNQPTALYNAMTAPVTPYAIRGVAWYQGESNAANPEAYARLLPALIADWRHQWNMGDLPFCYVQLPNFMETNYLPEESNWAELRNAQLKALAVPHTGMAVAIDVGEWNDIHPDNKKEVGYRLALAAEKTAYHENGITCSGPLYESAVVAGNKIIISFSNTGSGLMTIDGEAPAQFAIAGADKKFVWASAAIEGNKVVVWNEDLPKPLYVRYAWADNPENPNLYNKEGLPASPFATDK